MAERLRIDRLGRGGDGIADTPSGPVYVPYALPGETVEVEPWAGDRERRRLTRIDAGSPERIDARCLHFGSCGGCAMQHWSAERYREWKRESVIEALTQSGLDVAVDPLIDAHGEGRRRVVLHARGSTRGAVEVGFAALRAHDIIAIENCPVLAPALARVLDVARDIAEVLAAARKPLDIQATASETGIDIDVRGSGPLSPALSGRLAQLADKHRLARLTRHGELVAQRVAPVVEMGRARVPLPPGAFLQATAAGEAILAALVEEHTAKAKTIADLFCGIGPFALRLAERARVSALDSDAPAIAALSRAVATTPGLKPIDAQTRDLFRRPLLPPELKTFDAVVFDPPRQGAETQARALAASAVPVVVAVSCHAGTFSRDAKILTDGGYRLARVTPVDQFLYSPHVELVARFDKG